MRTKSSSIYNATTIIQKFYKFWVNYMSPANFNYWWNFGSMSLICLMLQIATGIFLAMHYKSDVNLAFISMEYMFRNVQYGWFMKYLHANVASVFFMVVYLHMLRTLMFGSFLYPRQLLWGSGVIMFVLMIATAFLGYVLPWGQMSFWAATVMTSLFSAMPLVGMDIVLWLWGGFSVDDATLNSFFSLHFFLPFVMLVISLIHLIFLHEFGSSNPLGTIFSTDGNPMGPFYMIKDLNGMNYMFMFMTFLVFFVPNYLGHPDNYILANPLVTPAHIVPEWYFLPLYAMLSSIPSKLLGVIVLALAMIVLLFLPAIVGKFNVISSMYFKPALKVLILFLIVNCWVLGWVGGKPVVEPYFFMGQLATFMYFVLFVCYSWIGLIEQGLVKVHSSKLYA